MTMLKYLIFLFPLCVLNTQRISYTDYESYLNEDIKIETPLTDTYILLPIEMCNTCLITHIQTLNSLDFNLKVSLVFVGSNKKLISYKLKHLETSKISLFIDSKNVAIQKNLCNKEKIVFVSARDKHIKTIDYDDFDGFKKLLNEI